MIDRGTQDESSKSSPRSEGGEGGLDFFSELKRRRVYRVGAAYLAVAIAGLEGASMVFPVLGFGATAFNALVVLSLVGFPVTVGLAWTFDITDQGIERTPTADASTAGSPPGDRWVRVKAALVGAGFVVVAWAGLRLWQAPGTGDLPPFPVGAPLLAVLPFDDYSPAGDQAYFADGLHEEVLHRLAQVPGIRLTSRTSAAYFGGTGLPATAIGDSLGADYVLEGSVRTDPDSILLTVQLVDASTDEHLWSESLRRSHTLDGILDLQRTLASRVAGALGDTFGEPLDVAPTTSLEAYQAYLRGIYHEGRFSTEDWWAAVDEYERALELDPDFGHAHARLALTLAIVNNYGLRSQGELFPRIRRHAAEAYRLIPDEPRAHLARLAVHWPIEWDWEAARADLERALALDPHLVDALWPLGEWHGVIAGNTDRGLELILRAQELDPYSTRLRVVRMWILANGRRWEEAVEEGRALLEVDPTNRTIALSLIPCLALAGRTDEARALFLPILESSPTPRPVGLAAAAAWVGEERVAREILRSAERLKASGGSVPASGIAAAYAILGDVDPAMDWLETSFRDEGGVYYLRHADWDNVATDPRFQAIWDRVGLAGVHSSLAEPET